MVVTWVKEGVVPLVFSTASRFSTCCDSVRVSLWRGGRGEFLTSFALFVFVIVHVHWLRCYGGGEVWVRFRHGVATRGFSRGRGVLYHILVGYKLPHGGQVVQLVSLCLSAWCLARQGVVMIYCSVRRGGCFIRPSWFGCGLPHGGRVVRLVSLCLSAWCLTRRRVLL